MTRLVFSIYRVSRISILKGLELQSWLMGLIAGRLPALGRIALAYLPDTRGRILTEMSVLRHDEDDFTLITAAAAEWHDFKLSKRSLPSAVPFH